MGGGSSIVDTLLAEFSDLPDAGRAVRIVLRLLLAAALAGAVGYEREHKGKAAGMRTHMLVGLGAALFVIVPQQMGASAGDMTRVLQGVIAGIGFLGAGSIIKGQSEQDVKGLTTASSIWLTAAVGVTAGVGLAGTAILSTVLALIVLAAFGHFQGPSAAQRD